VMSRETAIGLGSLGGRTLRTPIDEAINVVSGIPEAIYNMVISILADSHRCDSIAARDAEAVAQSRWKYVNSSNTPAKLLL